MSTKGFAPKEKSILEDQLRSWLLLALQGDSLAYKSFLDGVGRMIRAYLRRSTYGRMNSADRVEDLVQDVLLSVHTKRDTYDTSMPLLPWVYAIAKYRLIDSLRSDSRKVKTVTWEENFDSAVFYNPEATGAATAATEVQDLLGQLSDRQKEILLLAKVEGVPLAEIGKKMNMSLSAVKVTIHRTLQSLRKKQAQSEKDDEENS